jgi:hypothetical protein
MQYTKKVLIPTFIVILIVFSVLLLFFSGSFGSKYCQADSDCKSNSGCNAGCWSEIPKISGPICPSLAGPMLCICHNNNCEDGLVVIQQVSSERAIQICDLIQKGTMGSNECYFYAAKYTKNESICYLIDYNETTFRLLSRTLEDCKMQSK